jgi:hypothetical protein
MRVDRRAKPRQLGFLVEARVTHQTDDTDSLGKLRRKCSLLRYQVADSNTDHHLESRRERYQVSHLRNLVMKTAPL